MMLLSLAWKSLRNRWFTATLCVLTIGLSSCILLGVEHIRISTKKSFQSTVSGTDLIVGARTGAVPLLLYTVFHVGEATNNVSFSSYQRISALPSVAWTIPISLGDSYFGFRVVGTTDAMFAHYRYGAKHALSFQSGRAFNGRNGEAVVGADVALKRRLQLGDLLSVAHGTGNVGFVQHAHAQQTLVGILKRTGTPIDQSVFVSLDAIEKMHEGFDGSARALSSAKRDRPAIQSTAQPTMARAIDPESDHDADHHDHSHAESDSDETLAQPKAITAFFVGLKTRPMALGLQRVINNDPSEPLLAILPTPTLQQLWRLMSVAERAMTIVAIAVVLSGLIGMMMTLMATLEQRRREMAILRAVGAKPWHIFMLLMLESAVLCVLGLLLGAILLSCLLWLLAPMLSQFGLFLDNDWLNRNSIALLLGIFAASALLALVPASLAWRRSLADGLSIRI
jgi:putative ABC transport system permease protein